MSKCHISANSKTGLRAIGWRKIQHCINKLMSISIKKKFASCTVIMMPKRIFTCEVPCSHQFHAKLKKLLSDDWVINH